MSFREVAPIQFVGLCPFPLKPAKALFSFAKSLNAGLVCTDRLSLTMAGILPRDIDDAEGLQSSDYSVYQIVEQDDLLFKLIDLQNIKTSRVGHVPSRGIVSPAYIRLRAADASVCVRYYFWFFYAMYSQNIFNAMGAGVRQTLNQSDLLSVHVPVPDQEQQHAIASYLDAETVRIDGLIEEKQRLAGMLVELRGGVIRERTTGADLKVARISTGDVFMPDLPAGWGLVALGRYSRITNGSTPLKDNLAYWQGGHYPWLNSSVVNGDQVTEGSELVTAEALRQCHLPIVPPGSVLVALTGQGKTRGQATVLRIEATINQHLAAIVCDEDHLDGEFVFWALTGQYAALRMVSDGQGGTKGALTCDELGRFRIPKPPIEVQRSIAKALYDETRKIDHLLKHVEDEIRLLQELRAATITDAVLGRIDVREHMKN